MKLAKPSRHKKIPFPSGEKPENRYVVYSPKKGVFPFVSEITDADPLLLADTERHGVSGSFVRDLSFVMEIPPKRMYRILGIPKSTAARKVSAGGMLSGLSGTAAIAMARLLGLVEESVHQSTALGNTEFNCAKWLGEWIEKPQPALGGRKPADLIATPTGVELVAKLLGSAQSGSYQ